MAMMNCRECGRVVGATATACSLCGTPVQRPRARTKIFVAIALTAGVLVAAAIYQFTGAPDTMDALPAGSDQPTSAGPAREISANQLQSAYAENADTADREFKGARLIVSGVVKDIRTEINQSAYIIFAATNDFGGPQALLLKSQLPAAVGLKEGSSIRVSCVGDGDVIKTPMLKDCVIETASSDSAKQNESVAVVKK